MSIKIVPDALTPEDIALRIALANWLTSKTGARDDPSSWDVVAEISQIKDDSDHWGYVTQTADVLVRAMTSIQK